MPRKLQDAKLDKWTAREKLAIQPEPHWRTIQEGQAIGYRRLPGGKAGSWIARHYDSATRRRTYQALGAADDMAKADGGTTLNFAQAQGAARVWFDALARSGGKVVTPITVAEAVAAYRADYESRSGRATGKLDVRLNTHILPAFGNRLVKDLNAAELTAWRNKLATEPAKRRTPKPGNVTRTDNRKAARTRASRAPLVDPQEALRKRQASANRTLATFKAVLNFMFKTGRVESDLAWRRVTPFKGADQAKVRALTDDEARRFVAACAADFRAIAVSALLTGADYGELRTARVVGLDVVAQALTVSKKRGEHRLVLTDQALQHFTALASGKVQSDLLHVREDGEPWGDSHQIRRMALACEAAKITPAINFHVLRHTYATRALRNGTSMPEIGFQIGHKPGSPITARHYAHVLESDVAKSIKRSMGDLTFDAASADEA